MRSGEYIYFHDTQIENKFKEQEEVMNELALRNISRRGMSSVLQELVSFISNDQAKHLTEADKTEFKAMFSKLLKSL